MEDILLKISSLLLVATLTAYYSLRQYFRQKEHEIIIERYLKEGIDLISGYTDHVYSVFRQNLSRSIVILAKFKSTQEASLDMPKELYSGKFLRYDPGSYSFTPFSKIRYLIDSDIFLKAYLDLINFLDITTDFFENGLCYEIKNFVEKKNRSVSSSKLHKACKARVEKYGEESLKYYTILYELQNIAKILERKKFTFNKLEKLRNHPEIRQSVQEMKKEFAEKEE